MEYRTLHGMHNLPDCLNNRYRALNDLIQSIIAARPSSFDDCSNSSSAARTAADLLESSSGNNEVGVNLMCDFWKTLQDDPDFNLTRDVQQSLYVQNCTGKCRSACSGSGKSSGVRPCKREPKAIREDRTPTKGSCYLISTKAATMSQEDMLARKGSCCPTSNKAAALREEDKSMNRSCCSSSAKTAQECQEMMAPKKRSCSFGSAKGAPLTQVLCNLKGAASFEKKCSDKVYKLETAQKNLMKQISSLEEKEKKGLDRLKEADSMWSTMEASYKKKLADAQNRYAALQKDLKEVEASSNKWRKNKKDLESQLKNIEESSNEIKEKTIQKENDVNILEMEIADYKKRIATNMKDIEAAKNSYTSKKQASEAKIERINREKKKTEQTLDYDCKCKDKKENEGICCIKDARLDLQKICRSLLQKKLENEDLRAEKQALLQEINLLQVTSDACTKRCARREKNIAEETARIDKEIYKFKVQCTKCNKHTDSADIQGFCTDCPKCKIAQACLNEGDHCSTDQDKVCICTRIKEKFLDNVFENMYTVLEKQVHTCTGREMADCIKHCLERSRNGKLDKETKRILHDFVLGTVKKNLNLTIVGGAVKTRCEMDPKTYEQLMLCLKDVAVTAPVKEDKGTAAKKMPCSRWSSTSECNCPKGPSQCPCIKRAPKPSTNSSSCEPACNENVPEELSSPSNDTACYVDCSVSGKRKPCGGNTCSITTNMRAAQCVLGPHVLAAMSAQHTHRTTPVVPSTPCVFKASRISGHKAVESCHAESGHVSAEIEDILNKGTTANSQDITKENHQLKLSLSNTSLAQANLKPVSSLRKLFLFGDQQQEKILEKITKTNHDQNYTKEQYKIAFKNENGESTRQFTELTQTPSGKLVFELDKRTIKIIEETSMTDPYLYMSIKTSSSGHVLVDFDRDNTHRLTVTQTPSGRRLININKNMIKILKDILSNKMQNVSLSKNIELPSSPKRSESAIEVNTDNDSIYLKNMVNVKNDYDSKFLQPQDIQIKNESNEGHIYPKTILESVCNQTMSDIDLLLNSSRGTTHSDPNIPLKGITEPILTGNYFTNTSGPILTERLLKHEKIKELKCKYSQTTSDLDCCKLLNATYIILTDNKKNTKTYKQALLNNKNKDEPACSCDISNTSSYSCNTITGFDDPRELLASSWKASTSKSFDNVNYRSEFKHFYKQGNVNVAVKIQVGYGVIWDLQAVVTKTKSGTIAIYARGTPYLKEIIFDGKECPVLLSKTVSGTYFVSIGNIDQNFNATLIKTPSEGMLLIPTSSQEKYGNGHEVKDFFKLKLSIMKNQLIELPAVLKTTSSKNYMVILDKEFETCYKEAVKEYFGNKLESSVALHTTSSGKYILDLEDEDENHLKKKNALLVKTLSGNIKVLVHGPEFELMVQQKLNINSTSPTHALSRINSNFLASNRELHRGNLKKSKNLDNHVSHKQLCEKVNVKLQDSLLLPSEPSAAPKTSSSSRYAVVKNESKVLNNSQSNSMSDTQGLMPVKWLDSGEITIKLHSKDKAKPHYGTLKITPSGHLDVEVDEEVTKDKTLSCTKKEALRCTIGTRSKHATQLIDSVHEAFVTTTEAKSVDCCSDPFTCVCSESIFDTIDWSNDKIAKQIYPCIRKEVNGDTYNAKINDGVPIPSTSLDESALIDIEPSCDLKACKNEFKSTKHCHYLFGCSYPQNQPGNNGMSSELLEMSECCQARVTRPMKRMDIDLSSEQPMVQNVRQVRDSLNNLPLQLPYFLKDFCL